jgi:hypothetical protein
MKRIIFLLLIGFLFIQINAQDIISKTNAEIHTKKSIKKEKKLKRLKGNYFTVSPGIGSSYAGIGLSLQYLTPGKLRFGFHGGAGFQEPGDFCLTGGIKIYIWNYIYADVQFGRFGSWETGTIDYYGYTKTGSGILYGPMFLIGYDLFISDHFGLNFGAGITRDINHDKEIGPAMDFGFIFRF